MSLRLLLLASLWLLLSGCGGSKRTKLTDCFRIVEMIDCKQQPSVGACRARLNNGVHVQVYPPAKTNDIVCELRKGEFRRP